VQAAKTVALFAFDALLGVEGVPIILGDVGVTRRARFGPGRGSPGNLHILRKRGDRMLRLLGCTRWKGNDSNQGKN